MAAIVSQGLTVITTNYDIVAEFLFAIAECPVNACVPATPSGKLYTNLESAPRLCKLHGSINWFAKDNGDVEVEDGLSKFLGTEHFWAHAGNRVFSAPGLPVIIPPTFFKDRNPRLPKSIWPTSRDALARARNIVFVGYSFIDYSTALTEERLSEPYAFTGNAASILASRIAYLLNLKGPCIAMDTACSSSLVAVHMACESIRSGTSRMALAGGVQVLTSGKFHQLAASVGMLSADGRCKTFDHRADGFVPGEGVGVVVLKPLDTAIHDGDPIHGVIKGSDINQDGKTNGITAPSAPSQTALLLSVYDKFGIRPENIGYVEAHGTGTELGDPIEVRALTHAFRKYTGKRRYCAVGSVKTNIGHTIAAAGISSLIKVLLCIKHRKLVPTLHLEKENRLIDFKDSPFFANTRLLDWQSIADAPRCAAVSSFGFSGTNAHVVVEEYEEEVRGEGSGVRGEPQLIVLSAKNEDRLKAYAASIVNYLANENRKSSDQTADKSKIENPPDRRRASRKSTIEDIAYTLQTGRKAMEERLALVSRTSRNSSGNSSSTPWRGVMLPDASQAA